MFLDPFIDYISEGLLLGSKALRTRRTIRIDNFIFYLHYNVTTTLLLCASMLVTVGLYVSDPIECISDAVVSGVIDDFCWVHSTFTVPGQWNNGTNKEVLYAHPGVAPLPQQSTVLKFHGYYQWISYILAFQALLLYVPKLLWKMWEGGKVKMLISLLESDGPLFQNNNEDLDFDTTNSTNPSFHDHQFYQENELCKYLKDNLGENEQYFRKLIFCELLNFLLIIVEIYITSITNLGFSEVLQIMLINDPLQREDFIAQIFPKVTKCTFTVYGPTGSLQMYDNLCVLPFNVINEKIYIMMWLWLVILAVLSLFMLVWRILLLLVPKVRMTILKNSTRHKNMDSFQSLRDILKPGDWFILHQLGKNLDLLQFSTIIKMLQSKISLLQTGI